MTLSYFELIAYLIGFMLIIEGLLPFFFPNRYRALLISVLARSPHEIHRFGGFGILIGCAIFIILFFV